ncbi:MAG: tRNA1(Val) (adenine(37)-N6)-methyltransferase [Thermodesulfobacteriota bacterium]
MKKYLWHEKEETLDTLFEGRLKIMQKKEGYRFSIDALLLASFGSAHPQDQIIDLGTGCGIIPLILAYQKKGRKIIGVEIQSSLADLARRNVLLNNFSGQIEIWEKDFKELPEENWRNFFDLVITNPPYRRLGAGRLNPHPEKAIARHEIKATLPDILEISYYILKEKGRLAIIYPARRVVDLFQEMRQRHLEPKKVQFVHSRAHEEACLVLVEAWKGGRVQTEVLPPFILYAAPGEYTPAAQKIFQGTDPQRLSPLAPED